MELQKNEEPPQHTVNLIGAGGDSQSKPADSTKKSPANKRNILIVVSDDCSHFTFEYASFTAFWDDCRYTKVGNICSLRSDDIYYVVYLRCTANCVTRRDCR